MRGHFKLWIAGRVRPEMRGKCMEILAAVGMAGKADAKATELSGGQQQRVAIARALVTDPPIALADEPTGNFDTRNADELFSLVRTLNKSKGTGLLIVTHDQRLAECCEIASRIPYVQGSANQNRSFSFHHPAGKGGLAWAVPVHGLPVFREEKVQ